jgi:hypothetical protein
MKKISAMQAFSDEILKEQKLTIGVDLGDRRTQAISPSCRPGTGFGYWARSVYP